MKNKHALRSDNFFSTWVYKIEKHCEKDSGFEQAYICNLTTTELAELSSETRERAAYNLDAAISMYRETGEVPDPRGLMDYWLKRQTLGSINAEGQRLQDVKPLNEALTAFDKLAAEVKTNMTETTPLGLRKALEKSLNSVVYNKAADGGFDRLLSGRLNCNSGTFLYLNLAARLLPKAEQDRLVLIYTKGHVQPGAIETRTVGYDENQTQETSIQLLEMTSSSDFGRLVWDQELANTLGSHTIVKAFGGMLENAAQRPLREDTVLYHQPEGEVEKSAGNFSLDEAINLPHVHSFGKAQVPAGDLDRSSSGVADYPRGILETDIIEGQETN